MPRTSVRDLRAHIFSCKIYIEHSFLTVLHLLKSNQYKTKNRFTHRHAGRRAFAAMPTSSLPRPQLTGRVSHAFWPGRIACPANLPSYSGNFRRPPRLPPRPAVQRTADGGLRAQPPRRRRQRRWRRRPGVAAAPRTGSPLRAQHLAVHCAAVAPCPFPAGRPCSLPPRRRPQPRRLSCGRVRRPVAGGEGAPRSALDGGRRQPPPAAAPSHACESGHGIYRPEADRRRR